MPNINEVITRVDAVKLNAYSQEEKARWLIELDGRIFREVMKCFGEYPPSSYPEDAEKELLVMPPYDNIYDLYLFAMIDFTNREIANYNNSAAMFDMAYDEFKKEWHRTHLPIPSGSINTMGDSRGEGVGGACFEQMIENHNNAEGSHSFLIDLITQRYNGLLDMINTYKESLDKEATKDDISVAVAEHQNSIFAHAELFEGLAANYDPAGSAAAAETNAKAYADSLSGNYDVAGSAATAETNAKEYADGLFESYDSVGSAAEAEANAKAYADSLSGNYDPAGSAAAAEARAKAYAEGLSWEYDPDNKGDTLITEGEGKGSIIQKGHDYYDYPEYRSTASSLNGVALGGNNHVSGNWGIAVNAGNAVDAAYGFAANLGNKVGEGASSAFVAGHCNEAKHPYQAMFGVYGDAGNSAHVFIIGNGDGSTKSNAFTVDTGGNVVAKNSFSSKSIVGSEISAHKIATRNITTYSIAAENITTENITTENITTEKIEIGSAEIDEKNALKLNQISYKTNFSENTIEQVIDTIRSGVIPDSWNIGDELPVEINGELRPIVIIGKNADTFVDGTKAPFTFQFKYLYDDWKAPMEEGNTIPKTGWENSTMRKTVLPGVLDTFPSLLKDSIGAVKKVTPAKYLDGVEVNATQYTDDNLFLLSFSEFGLVSDEAIYDNNSCRPKTTEEGVYGDCFLRNIDISSSKYTSILGNETGARNGFSPNEEHYFAPTFCITNKPALRIGKTFLTEEKLQELLKVTEV